MLSFCLAILGGALAIITSASRFKKYAIKIKIVGGLVAIIGGTFVWDLQERKDNWQLSRDQRSKLAAVLASKNTHISIAYFPINSEPLANRYAYDVLTNFANAGWPYLLVSPNWVVPLQAHGLMIATCPHPPAALKAQVEQEVSALRRLLTQAQIPVSDQHGTEEFLQDKITETGWRRCTVGLIFGQPPSAYERINPYLQLCPGPICLRNENRRTIGQPRRHSGKGT
jgi:hypothetical protein